MEFEHAVTLIVALSITAAAILLRLACCLFIVLGEWLKLLLLA